MFGNVQEGAFQVLRGEGTVFHFISKSEQLGGSCQARESIQQEVEDL